MRKDSFDETLLIRNPISFSFAKISGRITYPTVMAKPRAKHHFGLIFGITGVVATTVTAIVFAAIGAAWHIPLIKSITIQNPEELVREYEKNCTFVPDGLVLAKKLSDGKRTIVSSSEYIVDASSFQRGTIGEYEIGIFLKGENNVGASYSVNVVDEEIASLSLGEHRAVYYAGESPLPQDIVLNKVCVSGSIREAKPLEYLLDLSSFDANAVGIYTIGVSLKSNSVFSLSYNVEVKPLEEANLDGRYAYVEWVGDYGQPTIYALDIVDGSISSRYSEIIVNGKLEREVINGEIRLTVIGHDQSMVYQPAMRTLLVSGIAGDPDMSCFRLDRTDIMMTLIGADEVDKNTKFVAEGGRLSLSSIDYFAYRYGGIYLDASMNEPLTHDHIFASDATAFVGVKPIIDVNKPFLGVWYREDVSRNREVAFHILESGAYYADPAYQKPYTIQNKDGVYWIRIKDGSVLVYRSEVDSMEILSPETGRAFLYLKRYNPEVQVLVTLETNYGSTINYVVDKGMSLQTAFVSEDTINWNDIPGYAGEPIETDITFTDVGSSMIGLSDFGGLYGTMKDNVQIVGSWEAERLNSGHSYWLRFVSNYQEIKLGWLSFNANYYSKGFYQLTAHFDDGTILEVLCGDKTLKIENTAYRLNTAPWSGLPFLGDYVSSDGKEAFLLETASLTYKQTYQSGYVATLYFGVTLTSLSDTRAEGYYIYQDQDDKRIEKSFLLEVVDEKWNLTFDGTTYVRLVGQLL